MKTPPKRFGAAFSYCGKGVRNGKTIVYDMEFDCVHIY